MTCEEFWGGGLQDPDHLRECRECSIRADRQEQLALGLNRLGAQMRHLEAPERVERNLLAGFRGRTGLMPAQRAASLWWAVGTWAAAVVVTAGLALFLTRGHQPERTERMSRHATQLASVESLPDADPAGGEGAEGFIPLPNAELIAPNEAVNLVRIEVSRSTMIALGYAVSEEQGGEPVEADVMLGANGVARAVRFLQ